MRVARVDEKKIENDIRPARGKCAICAGGNHILRYKKPCVAIWENLKKILPFAVRLKFFYDFLFHSNMLCLRYQKVPPKK